MFIENRRVGLILESTLILVASTLIGLSAESQTPVYPTPSLTSIPSISSFVAPFATADFNNDGRPDLAYVITGGVQLALQTSTGGVTIPAALSACSSSYSTPVALIAADFNNDTKPDIAFTCGGYVTVLLGNGDGTFQSAAFYAVGGAAQLAPAADLNGDGYLDIAVTGANGVSVLLNKGTGGAGTFSAGTTLSTAASAMGIGVGDFNGDGKKDLFLLESVGNSAIYLGKGDGTFPTSQVVSAPGAGSYFAIADFNQDGISDLAFTPPSSVTTTIAVSVLLGSKTGSVITGTTVSLPNLTPSVFSGLIPAGSTHNGADVDLALSSTDGRVVILFGDGSGDFSVGPTYLLPSYGASTAPIAVPTTSGTVNLVSYAPYGTTGSSIAQLSGNADGTFKGVPNQPTKSAVPLAVGDFNGDGLTDALTVTTAGTLTTNLSRGNGTFQPVATGQQIVPGTLVSGDFNGDGKLDVIDVQPGTPVGPGTSVVNGQMVFYAGNGDGTFQAAGPAVSFNFQGTTVSAVGDFNGDGKLDIVVSYSATLVNPGTGLIFVPGKGDGTFGTPVYFAASQTGGAVLVADINGDHKLDIVWGTNVYLGNGDGTFNQQPTGVPNGAIALADLNGDGYPDILTIVGAYAGKGNAAFIATPFFTFPSSVEFSFLSAVVGNVNGDNIPDIIATQSFLAQGLTSDQKISVFLGGGSGTFTLDPNTYYPGTGNASGFLARLNNQAPALTSDKSLDYITPTTDGLTVSSTGITVLLNSTNPAPSAPNPLPSKTTLSASSSSIVAGQQVTLNATVTGLNPTGTVTFSSSTTVLGMSNVINGTATYVATLNTAGMVSISASYGGDTNNQISNSSAVSIQVGQAGTITTLTAGSATVNLTKSVSLLASVAGLSPTGSITFSNGSNTIATVPLANGAASYIWTPSAAGMYSVVAKYAGDANNQASSSSTASIVVVAPDFTVTANPTSATVTRGQSAMAVFTVTGVGGYAGTVSFSCGTVPSEVTCSFSPTSVTPGTNGGSSNLTITTTAASAALRMPHDTSSGIALASFFCLGLLPFGFSRRPRRVVSGVFAVVMLVGAVNLIGCSGGSSNSNPGTPVGAQSVTVTVNDTTNSLSHQVSFNLNVQ